MTRRRRRHPRTALVVSVVLAFVAGVFVDWWLRSYGPPQPAELETQHRKLKTDNRELTTDNRELKTDRPVATSGSIPAHLRVPIDGANVDSWKGGFAERRGDRPHEAVDILAPRDTPVHAVDDGSIAKLFTSKAGGLTIYQFDPAGRLCYYYAHLQRYADGLHDGQPVSKGEVIGYVGTSGNAPPNTPHLHFAVFELDDKHRWWKGRAIDPYQVFRHTMP